MENFILRAVRRQNNPGSFSSNPYKVMWEYIYDFFKKISNEPKKFAPGDT